MSCILSSKQLDSGPIGMYGVSDLIGVFRGSGITIELKVRKDKLTPKQERFLNQRREVGGIASPSWPKALRM